MVSAAALTFVHTDARDAELRAREALAVVTDRDDPADATVAVRSRRVSVHDALEGIRFVRGHPILLGVISLDLFAVLFGGAVALLPAIAEDRLGVGAVGPRDGCAPRWASAPAR